MSIADEITQLDREWERECRTLMMRGRYGSSFVPTQGSSLFVAIIACAAGLLLLVFGASVPHTGSFTLFGVAGILVGIAYGVSGTAKANAYRRAEGCYQRRRAELMAQTQDAQ
jgi:hypothetical protein